MILDIDTNKDNEVIIDSIKSFEDALVDFEILGYVWYNGKKPTDFIDEKVIWYLKTHKEHLYLVAWKEKKLNISHWKMFKED